MRTIKTGFAFAAVFALGASAALAFDEQKAAPQSPAGLVVKELADGTTLTEPKADGGFAIQIPGLGKLGVIPKLDFGLDLLYGTKEPATAPIGTPETAEANDGLQIRGTVRHRF